MWAWCIITRSGKPLPSHGYGSLARAAVSNWMNSPGHRANILHRQMKFPGSAAHVTTQADDATIGQRILCAYAQTFPTLQNLW